jgi:predicted ATPase
LVWFGRADIEECPSGLQHGMPVHVVVLCRRCDKVVPIEDFENHLGRKHKVA